MKRSSRIIWVISLMFFATGCSGYKVVGYSLPEVSPDRAQENKDAEVNVGTQVRLNLIDGSKVEGKVKIISPSEIVLAAEGRSAQPRGYTDDHIVSIESKSSSGPDAAPIIIGGVVVLIVGAAIFASSMSDLNSGFGN